MCMQVENGLAIAESASGEFKKSMNKKKPLPAG